MKHYTYNDVTTDTLPGVITLPNGDQLSPVTEISFVANGGEIIEDGEPTHYEELCDACDVFIAVVLDIQKFIGDTDFLGGIDQMGMLENSEAAQADPITALKLAQRWAAANTRCNFFADKPDLYEEFHSPKWFYFAWDRFMQQLEASNEEVEEVEPETESSNE